MSDKEPGTPDPSDPPPPSDPTAAPPPSPESAYPPPPPYGPPGFGPAPGHQLPPGQDPWQAYGSQPGYDPSAHATPGYEPSAYGVPGYGAPGYGAAGYQLPSGYYAGPEDPLVSADFGGWWRRSFALLSAVWRPAAQVQLLWAIPLVVVGILGVFYRTETVAYDSSATPDFGELGRVLLLVMPFASIAVLLSVVAQLATLDVLVQQATGRPVSVGQALRTGLRRFPAMFGWQLVGGLVVLVGLIFCILPGIYASLVFMILPPIVLLERGRGVSRAFELFHADFGAAAARIATVVGLYIGFFLAESFVNAVLSVPAGDATTALGIVSAILSAAFSVATGVVITPLILTAYADMRARREPFSTAYLVAQPATR